MAAYLPPESAVRRHLDEHWQRSPEVDLLRDIEHSNRVLVWMQTKSGAKGIDYPERVDLPWDPIPDGAMQGDRMTIEEADRFLGWDKLKAAGRDATEEDPENGR